MPKISIITPTYNRTDVLPRAIESVRQQTLQDYEHIIIDDGSTDNTKNTVANYDDDRIRYTRLEQNRGVATALNKGIELAKGDYISFLDSDDEYLPKRLEITNQILNNDANRVGGIFHSFRHIDNNRTYIHSVPNGEIELADLAEKNRIAGTSNTMYRSAIFNQVGRFDEQLKSSVDYDFQLRVLRKFRLIGINRVLCNKYDYVQGIQDNPRKVRQGLERVIKKHRDILTKENIFYRKCRVYISYLKTDNQKEADKYFQKEIQNHSPHPGVHTSYIVGRMCLRSDYKKAARQHLMKSIRSNPSSYKPYALLIASILPISGKKFFDLVGAIRSRNFAVLHKRRNRPD